MGEGSLSDESLTEVMFKLRSEGGVEIDQVKNQDGRDILLHRYRPGKGTETLDSS